MNLGLFAIPAAIAWRETLNDAVRLPEVGLAVSGVAGVGLLVARRRAGLWLLLGTALSAVLQVLLTIGLVLAYDSENPGWDLS